MPGTQLGTYKVVAQSTTNTCGLSAPNPWTFDVQLSRNGTTLYWSWMDGSPLVSGAIDGNSHASLEDTQTGNVDGTDASLGPCSMSRQDDLELAGPKAAGSPFTGTLGYSFSAAAGSDCSDQLTAAGGQYDALPCAITYSLSGTTQ
jgi:hypothetical protein